jgi:MinD-like ATPase involved in chromosome partitioning or flagellar assembly
MREGADQGLPVAVAAPHSEAAEAFRELAKQVDELRPRTRAHPELIIK